MRPLILTVEKEIECQPNMIRSMISNQHHSVTTYITRCIDKKYLSLVQDKKNVCFLQMNLNKPLRESLHDVRISSLNSFVFAAARAYNRDRMFPFQFEIRDDREVAVLVLKGFVSNPPRHFVTYIRRGFSDDLICVDDDEVTVCDKPYFSFVCIGLYFVNKYNIRDID